MLLITLMLDMHKHTFRLKVLTFACLPQPTPARSIRPFWDLSQIWKLYMNQENITNSLFRVLALMQLIIRGFTVNNSTFLFSHDSALYTLLSLEVMKSPPTHTHTLLPGVVFCTLSH